MLSLAAPLALLGLLALPLIRWLHRGGRHRRALAVAYLPLWRHAAASLAAAGQRQPPDPAWRRRALLAALATLALAAPQWRAPSQRITLWADDAPSMFVHEPGGTRLALALVQARREAAALGANDVELRLLGDPWRARDATADPPISTGAGAGGGKVPGPPPAALLRRDRRHWLLTDGVHAAVARWPAGMRPERVITVGSVRRNVGIERLAAQRMASGDERLEVLARLANGGAAAETRDIVLYADGREVARLRRTLAPGAAESLRFTLPMARALRAQLQPADALPDDDALALDLAPLARRRIAVDARCAPALRAAVAAHPALAAAPAEADDVAAVLDCSGFGPARRLPTLRLRDERPAAAPQGPAQWSARFAPDARPTFEVTGWRLAARLDAQPGDEVLLALGDAPAIVRRSGATPRIETALDFGRAAAQAASETPLLVNWMFEQLLGTRLLDAIALAERDAAAIRVVPIAAASASSASSAAPAATEGHVASDAETAPAARDLTRPLLLAALVVLLWEIAALTAQWRRLRGPDEEASA